ncbi:hypothetical protein [Costertonia aggregata]|uniref:Uncharacterized protein n=1 Tax=Costertonia aggregata TaxID=343403 RepID=A0A7H9AR25_9FLAO|nr:hypothetical protein [Costertonia aggregata]QLG45918.1 hypothetical protein HYG79_11345 [Costertonia aggregata]
MEYTQIIALSTSIIGIVFAIYTFWTKKKVEDKFKNILKEKRQKLEKELIELSKQHIEKKLKTDLEYQSKMNDLVIKIYKKELDNIQEKFKYELLVELNKKEKQILEESLEQKYLSGQVDYLNKLIHMSGSTKSIELENE